MAEQVRKMFANIADRYDTGNTVLSFGIHHLWRRIAVKHSAVRSGMRVLDCATGTGDLAISFKKAVGPQGTVVGTDFCEEMLAYAPNKARQKGLDVTFEVADAMNLPYENGSFDLASIAFGIRNVDSPAQCLSEMARVVKPGGQVLVLEFGQPEGWFSGPYTWYSRTVLPKLGSMVTGDQDAYEYLHDTSSQFPCREEFLELMRITESFSEAHYRPLSMGIAYVYYGTVQKR